jgi:hypothetical protein
MRKRDPRRCVICGEPAPRSPTGFYRWTCSDACLSEARSLARRDQIIDAEGKTWTKDRIIKAMQQWKHQHGRSPSVRQWAGGSAGNGTFPRKDRPNASTVQYLFGSWSAGLEAAGLQSNPRGRGGGRPPNKGTCASGKHRWIKKNIYVHPKTGIQSCQLCRRERAREYYYRQKAAHDRPSVASD